MLNQSLPLHPSRQFPWRGGDCWNCSEERVLDESGGVISLTPES